MVRVKTCQKHTSTHNLSQNKGFKSDYLSVWPVCLLPYYKVGSALLGECLWTQPGWNYTLMPLFTLRLRVNLDLHGVLQQDGFH